METPKKNITIRDVAREAGVSRQTVSRAFNNKGEISATTKAHVLAVAQRMGYRPSGLARSLSTNRTYTIGVLIPDSSSHFFAAVTKGVEITATAAGYGVFLVNTFKDLSREINALDALWDRRVDGAILYASFLSEEQLIAYIERFKNVVFINCQDVPALNRQVATLDVDDQEGARLAVAHLIDTGHTRIAYLAGPPNSLSGQRRLQGYRQAHSEHGLVVDETLIFSIVDPKSEELVFPTPMLTHPSKVTAIVAHNDLLALATMQACSKVGVRVPEDIAVIGFDDIPAAQLVNPALTTVRIDKQHLGKLAVHALISLIEDRGDDLSERHITITPEIVVRESTTGAQRISEGS